MGRVMREGGDECRGMSRGGWGDGKGTERKAESISLRKMDKEDAQR